MPVEIRELVIKTIVEDPKPDADTTGSGQSAGQQDVIIKACVEKILGILKDKTER